MKPMKIIFLVTGLIAVALGAIGVVLPILPSVPFFILALYCFSRSSERLHNWFMSTSFYKKHVDTFVTRKSMPLRSRLTVVITVTIVMGIGFYFMEAVPVGRVVLAIVWLAHIYYFMFKAGTGKRKGVQS